MSGKAREWDIRTDQLVLHGTSSEIQERCVVKQYGRIYEVQHHVGMYTVYRSESRPTLRGAIGLAERWVS